MPAFMGDVLQVFLSNEWSLGRGDIVQVTKEMQLRSRCTEKEYVVLRVWQHLDT